MQAGHRQVTKQRMYRRVNPNGGGSAWATREIAALDFLLGIPLEAEQEIVLAGLEADKNVGLNEKDSGVDDGIDVGVGGGGDEEEKVEIVGPGPSTTRSEIRTNMQNPNIVEGSNHGHSHGAGRWLESIVGKDSRFFTVKDAEQKRREQLELETDVLERPSDLEASSKEERNVDESGREAGVGIIPVSQGGAATGAATGTATGTDAVGVVSLAAQSTNLSASTHTHGALSSYIPGRRLDGHEPVMVCIPREAGGTEKKTRYRTVARKAVEREWELKMTKPNKRKGLLDGRIFFSNQSSYPVGVFSVIKYDPKNEEEFRRRQKLEAQGGGGAEFIFPTRDWRGVSYRDLLPRKERKNKTFNRMMQRRRKRALKKYENVRKMKAEAKGEYVIDYNEIHDWSSSSSDEDTDRLKSLSPTQSLSFHRSSSPRSQMIDPDESDDEVLFTPPSHSQDEEDEDKEESLSSSSSEESTTYTPGFLDDPDMVQGKHRTMLLGDKVTGCMASSIIHYVSPADLKADLNKQFRQRFDQWEPPKSQRKYIGAAVVDGAYTLMDKTEPSIKDNDDGERGSDDEGRRRKRKNSASQQDIENIRMPPSLTLSKIRKLKRSALLASIRAKIQVGTVALACVYFERLALDCRVDKSNRRLTFATCLLIAIKINEPNVKIVHEESSKASKRGVLKSWIKPRQDYDFLASLFTFFTHEWDLSLKKIFAAEWGTFSALGFKLHARPSEVSFHFKRLMKALEWSPLDYLGREMYDYWQDALAKEKAMEDKRAKRKSRRKKQKEKLLKRELEKMEKRRHSTEGDSSTIPDNVKAGSITDASPGDSLLRSQKRIPGMGLFSRISKSRRGSSHHDLQTIVSTTEDKPPVEKNKDGIRRSISSPNLLNNREYSLSQHDTIQEEDSADDK